MNHGMKRALAAAVVLFAQASRAQSLVPTYNTPTTATKSGGTFPKNFVADSHQLRPFQENITLQVDLKQLQAALPEGFAAIETPAGSGQGRLSIDANFQRHRERGGSVREASAVSFFTTTHNLKNGQTELVLLGIWVDNPLFAADENAVFGEGSVRVADDLTWEIQTKSDGTVEVKYHVTDAKTGLDFAVDAKLPTQVGKLTTIDNASPLRFRFTDGHTANKGMLFATRYYSTPITITPQRDPDSNGDAHSDGNGDDNNSDGDKIVGPPGDNLRVDAYGDGNHGDSVIGLPGGAINIEGIVGGDLRVMSETATTVTP